MKTKQKSIKYKTTDDQNIKVKSLKILINDKFIAIFMKRKKMEN